MRVQVWATLFAAVLVILASTALGVDRSKFRTCKDAAFCRRHRDKSTFEQYYLDLSGVEATESSMQGRLTGGPAGSPPLKLEMLFYNSGVVRMRITEDTKQEPRWETPDVILEDQLVPARVTVSRSDDAGVVKRAEQTESVYASFTSADGASVVAVLQAAPFRVDVYTNGELSLTANGEGKFHFEYRRKRDGAGATGTQAAGTDDAAPAKKIVDWGEDGKPIYEDGSVGDAGDAAGADAANDTPEDDSGMWVEKFGSHTDTKAHGPMSISMDISFPSAMAVYGIPEHASSMALKPTDGSSGGYKEPYRLYNLDVFEYELDEPMALYGAIPVMYGHTVAGGGHTSGVFWHNPTETYIDVRRGAERTSEGWASHWISESGIVDLSFLPGPRPADVFAQFTGLTGRQALPPRFSLGYHQCRWNYKDEADVFAVDAKFEEHNFPYDVLWLDIEHTNGKRYFTWDKPLFPNPAAMQNKLAERGRKMVTIVDPHIKRDSGYNVHSEASRNNLYVSTKDGAEYDGWCWPGSSSYLDFTDSNVRSWWADRFSLSNYEGSTLNLFTWNDMNEPSVFNGPEVSMPKDALSLAGVEHREWHNLYGFYHQMATAKGLVQRSPEQNNRPFVLTRSFYAGSQRYGAMWTGDNAARWDHLQIAAPMLLSINLGGLSFAGADVGGFFGNPDSELLERWYQAGAYQPFFRAHAHIETKRREPWLFGDATLHRLRDTVRQRYALLPFWYTTYFMSATTGQPVMRPLWVEYPADNEVLTMDDQWIIGSDLLVKPVTHAGQTSVSVYLPGSQPWYDVFDYTKYEPGHHTVAAPIDKIPVYQRGGSIVPRQQRPRRCSALMANDPYTLVVALDTNHKAVGSLYLDDGETYDYERGAFRLIEFAAEPTSASSLQLVASVRRDLGGDYNAENVVERVVVVGLGAAPSSVTSVQGANAQLTFNYDSATDVLTIRKPAVRVAQDFVVTITLN